MASALARLHNQIEIIETNVGVGFQTRRSRNAQESGANLGEIAVDEYATALARTTSPSFVPLILFATELQAMKDDLKGCSLADVLERLEKGKIGHTAAMAWLNV